MDRESRTPPCPCSSVWQERCRVPVGLSHLPRPLDEVYLVRGRRVKGGGGARRLLINQPDPPLPLPLYSHPTPPRTRPRSSLCAALVHARTHPLSSCLVQPLCARGSTAAGRAVRVRRRFATTSIRAHTHTHTSSRWSCCCGPERCWYNAHASVSDTLDERQSDVYSDATR